MKALFVHDHIFTRWNGAIYSAGRLPYAAFARYLEHFETVVVLARVREARTANEVRALQRSDGERVSFVLSPRDSSLLNRMGSKFRRRQRILEQVRATDVVIARLPSFLGVEVVQAARALRKPIAVEVVGHGFEVFWNHGSIAAKFCAPLVHWQTRRAVSAAEFALYVTRYFLQTVYPCHGQTAAASNVVLTVEESEAIARRLERIRSQPIPLVFGLVGTLSARHKGIDTAMYALAKLPRHIDWSLELVGEGDPAQWQRLAQTLGIAGRIKFCGMLPGSEAVRAWMRGVDIYLQPSLSEGLPRALIEAMSEGCAAVASSVSGIPELLSAQYLHAPGDPDGLSAAISSLVHDVNERTRVAQINIAVARTYDRDRLEAIRREFFRQFASLAGENG